MVQLGRYAALSAGSALAIIIHAFRSREQFYPAMLYLATSKISLVLLLNMALVFMCILWQAVKTVFLGSLREAEVERLNEQSWREVMEILFAMTIFREEFNVTFVAMITVLLFIKAFHWLSQKRVEYIETTPSVSRLSHFRIITFMALLLALDILFLHFSVAHLLRTRKASVSLFFAFEYVILATSTVATFLKYVLYVGDMVMEGQWDNKAVYIFYLELVRDLLHLSLYLFFFLVIFIHYGLPLHLVRELYETFRNFKARVADFIRYRKITSNMNDRFPDATEEELGRDATCIICREEMSAAKKLPCGHFFHVHCLRSWLERQQTCPTCRAPVSASDPVPASATEAPAAHQHGLQQDQPPVEGQGVVPDRRPFQGQPLAQWPGTGPSVYMRHPLYMQAAAASNNQSRSAVTCLAVQPGNMTWCPVYIPMIPQGHMVGAVGASQAGHSGASVEPGNQAGLSGTSDGQSNSSHQRSLNTSAQYYQMYMYGYVPLAGFAPQQQAQDAQASPASADQERQTGPSTRDVNPSLHQIQLNHLEHYIEVSLLCRISACNH
ncbi:hypothetical protein KC19_3G014700 [Ceratodon purpureus]|uniref:RING-type E3 ubiquitin transferase n=1 Tax=Ceratodon purpureus TaxID=3225 RepID=A0A8T0IG58_CERPU|nr:hypothetical protein KC19_3G014700 [Ceratodon purpureus]